MKIDEEMKRYEQTKEGIDSEWMNRKWTNELTPDFDSISISMGGRIDGGRRDGHGMDGQMDARWTDGSGMGERMGG